MARRMKSPWYRERTICVQTRPRLKQEMYLNKGDVAFSTIKARVCSYSCTFFFFDDQGNFSAFLSHVFSLGQTCIYTLEDIISDPSTQIYKVTVCLWTRYVAIVCPTLYTTVNATLSTFYCVFILPFSPFRNVK